MTAIDDDVVVKIDGGEVVFEDLGQREWVLVVQAEKKSNLEDMEEQMAEVLRHVREVRGLKYKDGEAVTLENLRERKPVRFFLRLKAAWLQEMFSARKEAEAKNG